jgi:mevalonate kinase
MKFNIPGKTFLVGEYSVLLGGSALGLCTKPNFEIDYLTQAATKYHIESPAGMYLTKHASVAGVSLTDPYLTGGFGKSTAEYFSVIIPELLKSKKHFSEILKEYRDLHSNHKVKPSGIDLAFQYFGYVTLVDPAIHYYQTFDWHFENLDFYIISTGLKIATFEHLKSLNLDNLKDLPKLSDKITKVYAENREFEFLALMKEWCELLNKHELTHPNSLELKQKLESLDSIKLAKPCGALGADVIIVFFAKTQKETVKSFLIENDLKIQAHSSDLAEGLLFQLQKHWSPNVG